MSPAIASAAGAGRSGTTTAETWGTTVARLLALWFTGLLAGSALANFLLEASLRGPIAFAVEYKQLVIRAYTVALPVLGVGGILSSLALLALARRSRRTVWPTVIAVACLVAGVVITLAVHFPINAQIVTWNPAPPGPDAVALLHRWSVANTVRTATALGAFTILLLAGGPSGARDEPVDQ